MKAKTSATNPKVVQTELAKLQEQLLSAQEEKRRVLADYQNLVRRGAEERLQLIALANRDLLTALLEPLEHLELAVAQLSDQGLGLALDQLKRTLAEFGLVEIEALGKQYDVDTMEAAEGSAPGGKVARVLRKGYRLNDKVIQHAKVILA